MDYEGQIWTSIKFTNITIIVFFVVSTIKILSS
jgi:hypothetical protein